MSLPASAFAIAGAQPDPLLGAGATRAGETGAAAQRESLAEHSTDRRYYQARTPEAPVSRPSLSLDKAGPGKSKQKLGRAR